MIRRDVWVLVATAGLAAAVPFAAAADPAPPPKLKAPTGPLPPPTPAQVEAAHAQAAGLFEQFPQAFPRGDMAPAGAAVPAVSPRSGPPLGMWVRTDLTVKTTLKLTADVLTIVLTEEPAPAGGGPPFRLTADYALSHDGGRLFGLFGPADGPLIAGPGRKVFIDLEGATFAAGFRVLEGELLVGKFRVSAAGIDDGLSQYVSGRYKRVAAPPPAAFRPPPPAPSAPVPAAVGGAVGMEMGAMLGDAAGRPRAGAILGAAGGAAVGTVAGQKAGDDTARSLLQQLESAAGWLGVGGVPDARPPTVEVVPGRPPTPPGGQP